MKKIITKKRIKTLILAIYNEIKIIAVKVGKKFISNVPKDKSLILFSAWFGQKYQDSPMYMYEYLLGGSCYHVFWYTKDRNLYNKLNNEGKPVVYSKSLRGLWMQIRAIMLVTTVEVYDFNIFFISNCILLDLGHGFPIKQSGYEIPNVSNQIIRLDCALRKDVVFYMTASSTFIKDITVKTSKISPNNVVFCNKPRTDVFFDVKLREGKNLIVEKKLKNGKKAIVYMPTHRSAGKKHIKMAEIMDLGMIDSFCENNNAVFLIKKHFYHRNEHEQLENYHNIFDITNKDIDVQTLLYQTDILISDYSASYIDYLLIDRPIILYPYDYEDYILSERSLYFKFEDNDCGYKAYCFDELISSLEKVCMTWQDDEHKVGRINAKRVYFDDDVSIGNTRQAIKQIIDELITDSYTSKWG